MATGITLLLGMSASEKEAALLAALRRDVLFSGCPSLPNNAGPVFALECQPGRYLLMVSISVEAANVTQLWVITRHPPAMPAAKHP